MDRWMIYRKFIEIFTAKYSLPTLERWLSRQKKDLFLPVIITQFKERRKTRTTYSLMRKKRRRRRFQSYLIHLQRIIKATRNQSTLIWCERTCYTIRRWTWNFVCLNSRFSPREENRFDIYTNTKKFSRARCVVFVERANKNGAFPPRGYDPKKKLHNRHPCTRSYVTRDTRLNKHNNHATGAYRNKFIHRLC